jgi:DNA ligase (NAD+)
MNSQEILLKLIKDCNYNLDIIINQLTNSYKINNLPSKEEWNKFLDELKTYLTEWNISYRTGESIVTDKEYDVVYELLKDFKPNDSFFQIGYNVSDKDSRKEKLPIIMGSLDKFKSINDILNWCKRHNIPTSTDVVLSPKYDGLSQLRNETSLKSWTRGDSDYGRNSTEHLNTIEKSNNKLSESHCYTSGEVIISKSNFKQYQERKLQEQKLNSKIDIPKAARNTVSGFINKDEVNKDITICDYIRYNHFNLEGKQIYNKDKQLDICNELNNVKVQYKKHKISELTEELLNDIYNEFNSEYECDGIVIDINSVDLRNKLGIHKEGNPNFSFAYKGNFETAYETVLNNIVDEVSKRGNIQPVGEINPVFIGGAKIENCTLNNYNNVFQFGLFPGTKIEVIRSGEVIPKIISVNGHKIPFKHLYNSTKEYDLAVEKLIEIRKEEIKNHSFLKEYCPSCNTKLKWDENETHLVCTNHNNCKEQRIKVISSFFDTIGVEEVKESTFRILYEEGYDSILKVLQLDINKLKTFEGFGNRKAEIVFNNIHKKLKDVDLSTLQHASGCFKKSGSKKLKLINDYILESKNQNPSLKELIEINGLSDILVNDYLNNIDKFNLFYKEIEQFINIKTQTISQPKQGSLTGLSFVFTGFRDDEMEKYIIDNGGEVKSGISKNVKYLIVKYKGSGSGKEQKAIDLGIEILDSDEFKLKFNNNYKTTKNLFNF